MREVGRGYSNLEYDLGEGARGSRQDHVAAILRRLTGAEAALVVNNNAAAVLLALAALAEGREVLVSRGELIEIGDGFRIPDVLARSGARLVEVGTTNRTRAADYERAIGPETGAAPARAPVELPRRRLHRAADDRRARRGRAPPRAAARGRPRLGRARRRCTTSRPPRDALAAGADLVCFSGDKLLGGPQAGIVVGRAELVERLRRHPLQRALRADKLTLAALEGTLALYLDADARARSRCCGCSRSPSRPCAPAPSGSRSSSAARSRRRSPASAAARCRSPSCRASRARSRRSSPAPLRAGEPPVVAVVRDGRLLLDCRTLADAELDEVAAAVARARG